MITKFEKRVIAMGLAVLMSLPVTGFSPVTVNAEEPDSAVLQEVQTGDEARQDSEYDVGNNEPVGEVIPDDAVFIPLETDSSESEQSDVWTEQIETTEESGSTVNSEERILYSTEDDTSIERQEIVLPENGDPVRIVTENETSYYSFTPKKTGVYYLDFEGSSFGFGIDDKDGGWSVSGITREYFETCEMTADETYYITVNGSGVQWNFGQVQDIKPGTHTTEISEPGQVRCFRLVYGISDIYQLQTNDGKLYAQNAGRGFYAYSYYSPQYIKIDTQESCFIRVGWDDDVSTGNITWSVQETVPEIVEAGEKVITYVESGDSVLYSFVPDISGKYRVSIDNSGIMDSNMWPVQGETLTAGETYYIEINVYGGQAEWEIEKVETVAVQTGENYSTGYRQAVDYEFTPAESGRYRFMSEQSGGIIVDEKGVLGFDYWVYLEAGSTYEIIVYPYDLQSEVTWSVNKASLIEITEGTEILSKVEEHIEYCFVPQTSGNYFLHSFDQGSNAVYNSDWTIADTDSYVEETGFGSKIYMEAGQTYYINISPSEDTAVWTLEALQTEGDYSYRVREDGTVAILKYNGDSADTSIPDTIQGKRVSSIGYGTFSNNAVLESVTVPASVTDLEYGAFQSCANLKTVGFAEGSMLQSIENSAFYQCSALTEISLPENLTYIGEQAFCNSGLTQIQIPDSVTSIGNMAFMGCEDLQEVNIGNGLTYVATDAFSGCDLTQIVIGNKVEKIELYGFSNNKNLTSVTIPNSVTEIEYRAFFGCKNLLDIEIPDSVEAIGRNAFDDTAWYTAQDDGPVYAGKVFYQYKGQISSENGTVQIADGTKGIAGGAFLNQTELTSVAIPNSITNIGANAFTGCTSLTEITIPMTVTRIDEYAVGYVSDTPWNMEKMENFTIYGVEGSAAQTYAQENGFDFVATAPAYIKGDVNSDGEVNIVDLRIVLRKVCGKIELDAGQILAADVETDNAVDIRDLRKILRFVCDKIDTLD